MKLYFKNIQFVFCKCLDEVSICHCYKIQNLNRKRNILTAMSKKIACYGFQLAYALIEGWNN